MPTRITFGAMAFRGFAGSLPDGTLSIFVLNGGGNSPTDQYLFASDVTSSATTLNAPSAQGAAVGNSTAGIIGVGSGIGMVNIYNYAGATVTTAGPSGTLAITPGLGAVTGNKTQGVFAGYNSTTTYKYNYADGSVIVGALLTAKAGSGAAAGNAALGIFSNLIPNSGLNPTAKYTYAGDTVIAATTLSNTYQGSAAGNSTEAIFSQVTGGATSKYTYASDVVSAAAALGGSPTQMQASGNSVVGIFSAASGPSTATYKYAYASDTTAAGGSLTGPTDQNCSVSNGCAGVSI